jgi:hypothetical protein
MSLFLLRVDGTRQIHATARRVDAIFRAECGGSAPERGPVA